MEPVVAINCSPARECLPLAPNASVWQDILAQAVTGETLAAMNYASLAEICDDPAEIADALEHAEGERGHAADFTAEGRLLGIEVTNNVGARHWKRLREAFLRCIEERDFIGSLIVQEIMLESFAVASYARVAAWRRAASAPPSPRLPPRKKSTSTTPWRSCGQSGSAIRRPSTTRCTACTLR